MFKYPKKTFAGTGKACIIDSVVLINVFLVADMVEISWKIFAADLLLGFFAAFVIFCVVMAFAYGVNKK